MEKHGRRIVMFNHLSADGYFAGPDGNLSWVTQDEEISRAAAAGMQTTDTILFGRRTYQMFASFWPKALDDAHTSPNPHGGERSSGLHDMAVWLNGATKVVFSKTLKEAAWKGSRLARDVDAREIQALKGQPGKDMIIFGSGSVVGQLAQQGLIDEFQFVVSPILLGSGRSLLSGLTHSTKLALIDARSFASGNVMLRYAARSG